MEEKRNGEQKTFYENGAIRKIKNYKNGLEDGEQKTFYENGAIRRIKNYKNGFEDGEQKTFYENGNLEDLQKYDNNKRIGEWKEFYEDGNLKIISYYENDNLKKQSTYSESGQLIEDFNVDYKNGMNFYIGKYLKKTNEIYKEGFYDNKGFTGILKTYYPNGNVQEIFHLEDDLYVGKYEKYYENGQLFISGEYNNNSMRDKEWKYYEENGYNLSYKIFNNGNLEKKLEYYDNKLLSEVVYFDDKIIVNNFNNNKLKSIEEIYKTEDKLKIYKFPDGCINYMTTKTSWKAYYPNGNLKFDYQMEGTNFKGEHKEYYENGNLKNECFYNLTKDGYSFKVGDESIYDESGKLITKNVYSINSFQENLYQSFEYYPNGNIKEVQNYKNNKLESYYETGELKEKYIYKNGELDGPFYMYDKKGNTIKHEIYSKGKLIENILKEQQKEKPTKGRATRGRATRGNSGNER